MRSLLSIVFVLTFSGVAIAGDFSDKDVIGRWYRGEHLGYNVLLTLSSDHTYNASWTGDQIDPKTNRPGEYGSASGKWKLEEDHLVITPTKETEDTKGDLSTMRLERRSGKVVLVPLHPLPVATDFHLDPMMVFERERR